MTDAPGLVIVDKAAGMTSHDVVARVRRLAGTRKVGHAGTLDPMATGVLVLGINRATRLLGHLMLTEKAYDATIRLGMSTTTDDAEGEVTATTPAGFLRPDLVDAELARQVGEIMQVPTAVSAIKVAGKRAYQRVRDGEEVELTARPVTIHSLEVRDRRVVEDCLDVDISVRCSSGTYIRAIARDLGATLGVGGHLTALRRTAVGGFDLSHAHTLEELADGLVLVPIAEAARATFGGVDLDETQAADVRFGRPIGLSLPGTGEHALFAPDGEFLALYEPTAGGARPVAVFVG
ncbi:MAG: tRNA pseudouridine synthase [Nocardioides sp.]|jgi:tRNA pseudouridine55 synthase|uniref:tRNA pseudouridine(55) synthase TruB n=1 Tax=Nocardioides sp. TaxID=35761 RepID=UPI002637FD44|nr:tRNA pseudouridine(55) synthase TruB [Nocardioides sp.]MCW2832887.1 tRNA pseudouridine synthase [Nocardioides sp.]